MSNKQYRNFHAKPFGEAVNEIAPNLNKMIDAPRSENNAQMFDISAMEGRDDLVRILKIMVNPDVCLTKGQQDILFADMYQYLKNPDQTKLLAMVAAINSYRTECSRCLTEKCLLRDPHDVK